jgi:hypothetical protein
MQRKVRRASNSTSSASSSSTTKYSSTAIWWAEAGWVGSCGVTIKCVRRAVFSPFPLASC